jgi:hypothetical protein
MLVFIFRSTPSFRFQILPGMPLVETSHLLDSLPFFEFDFTGYEQLI